MVVPKINSSHGPETRNIINAAIDSINTQGKTIQDLVADGQLTPEQYATLIQTINGMISKGDVTLNDISPEVLKLLQDSEGVPVNVLSIPRNRAVTHEKTTFLRTGKNLFNKEDVILGKIFVGGGLINDNADYSITNGYIYVGHLNTITTNHLINMVRYDEDYKFISFIGYPAGSTIDVSADEYIRFSFANIRSNELQVEAGTKVTTYEPFSQLLDKVKVRNSDLEDKTQQILSIANDSVQYSKNLVDESKASIGYSLTSLGNPTENASYILTEFIPVESSNKYVANGTTLLSEYDVNRNHLIRSSKVAGEVYSMRGDTKFVRVAYNVSNKGMFQFEKNTQPSSYVPYHKPKIGANSGGQTILSNKKIIWLGDSNTHLNNFPDFIDERTGSISSNGGFGGTRLTDRSKVNTTNNYYKLNGCSIVEAISTGDWSTLINAAQAIDLAENQNSIPKYYSQLQNIMTASENMNDIHAIVLKYGTNDSNSTDLTLGDTDSLDTSTWNGATNYVIKTMGETYPHIRVYFSAPVFRQLVPQSAELTGSDKNSDEWSKSVMLPDMVEAMSERCKVNHVPFKDLYNESGINKYTAPYYLKDKTHYSLSGDALVSQKLEGFLLSH